MTVPPRRHRAASKIVNITGISRHCLYFATHIQGAPRAAYSAPSSDRPDISINDQVMTPSKPLFCEQAHNDAYVTERIILPTANGKPVERQGHKTSGLRRLKDATAAGSPVNKTMVMDTTDGVPTRRWGRPGPRTATSGQGGWTGMTCRRNRHDRFADNALWLRQVALATRVL